MSVLKSLSVLAVFTLMMSVLPALSQAAGPEWTGGFPKLAQKNALLQWNPVKGATGYKVYRGEQKGKVKLIATVKVNRYIDKDVPSGKTFYYEVSAVVGGVEGAHSAAGAIKTAAEKAFVQLKTPALQGGHVKEQPDGKVSVGIRWEGAAGTDLVGVNVYRSKVKGKDFALIGSSSSDTYEDKDVQQGATYYYVVTSVDSQFNETKYSNEISVNIPAPAAAAKEAPGARAPQKPEATTMRKARLLFRIPADDASDREKSFAPQLSVDVKVDEAVGHIYVSSVIYGGILVYDMDGKFQFGIRKDGVEGTVKVTEPHCIALGRNGEVYLTDFSGPDVSVFDFSGRPLRTLKVDLAKIGVKGFPKNWGVALDKDGDIYVADSQVDRIHVYDHDWKHLYDVKGIKEYGLDGPSYIVVTGDGHLVVNNVGNVSLGIYGDSGQFVRKIGKMGQNAGELSYPSGVAIGNKGEIFVASGMSPNIQAFDIGGKFLYALCNEKADGPLSVESIRGICVDSKDRLYVSEGPANRVSVFQLMEGRVGVIPK